MSALDEVTAWEGTLSEAATSSAALRGAYPLADSLLRRGEHDLCLRVTQEALQRVTGQDVVLNLRYVACQAHLECGAGTDDLGPVVDALLARCDELYAAATVTRSADQARAASLRLFQAMSLLFHRRLHTSVDPSPLALDPVAFLRSLRSCRLYAALAAASERRPRAPRLLRRRRRPVRTVALLTSKPSHFAAPLRAAVAAIPAEVTEHLVHDLDPQWPGLSWLLAERAAALVTGQPAGTALPDALRAAEVCVVDWADEAAAWASVRLPRSPDAPRLVVRLHSIEALSLALHIIDWSRVDEVVYVSPFLRRLAEAVVPACAAVPSVIVRHSAPDVRTTKKPGSSWRTLGLIGWGQAVKDPLFALEVLADLRRADPAGGWTLRLVGTPLRDGARPWDRDYVARVDALMQDLEGAVELVAFTEDVWSELDRIGFILSTSLREADPHGVIEGVVSGAVPIVRNWPMVAPWGGAAEIFPDDWIVQTPQDAAQRIRAVDDPESTAAAATAWALAHPTRAEELDLLRRAIVGDVAR